MLFMIKVCIKKWLLMIVPILLLCMFTTGFTAFAYHSITNAPLYSWRLYNGLNGNGIGQNGNESRQEEENSQENIQEGRTEEEEKDLDSDSDLNETNETETIDCYSENDDPKNEDLQPIPTISPQSRTSSLWQSNMLTERPPHIRRQEGMDIRGIIPVVAENFSPAYGFINEHIDNVIASLMSEARSIRALSITFSYDVEYTQEIVSVVIYGRITSVIPRTRVRTVNFCTSTGELITLDDIFEIDIAPLVYRILNDKIRGNPGHYYPALRILDSLDSSTMAFIVTETSYVLLFNEHQISAVEAGVFEIEFRRDNIRVLTISYDDYQQMHNGYSLRMIPLRKVVEGLGFSVGYPGEHGGPYVRRGNRFVVTMRFDDSNFTINDMPPRALEVAPRIDDNGITYVPITFFDQVLPLTIYSIDSNGNITFLVYLD